MNSRAPEPCDVPAEHNGQVRFYVTGWKCDRHSPWAVQGLPAPAPGPGPLDHYTTQETNQP